MARIRLIAPLLVLALLVAALPAAAEKWVFLGQRHVTDKIDRDSIAVTVVYGAGTSDDLELRDVIPAGGQSRALDLRGATRVIKRIDFVYEAKSLGRRGAIVEVSGRR